MIFPLQIRTPVKLSMERRFIMKLFRKKMRIIRHSMVIPSRQLFSRIVFRSPLARFMESLSRLRNWTRVFSINLLVFILLTSLIVPVLAETDISSDIKYAWFGAPSNYPDDTTLYLTNTLQASFQNVTKNFYLALSFPFDTSNNFDYYTFSFVFSGSAVTDLSDSATFLSSDVYYLGNPTYIRSYTQYNLYLDPTYSGSNPFLAGPLEGFNFKNEFHNNSQIFQFTILADNFLNYQDKGYRENDVGILIKLNEDYIKSRSNVVVLLSLEGHYDLTDSTTDLEILKEISAATEQIVDSIDSVGQNVTDSIDTVGGNIVNSINGISDIISSDSGFDNNIDSSVNDFTGENSRLNALSTSILQSGVTVNGVTYVISNPSSNLFEGVLSAYGSDLANFNLSAPLSASIFRHVVDSWVSLFGILIFMSLIIGVLGSLLGRSSG